MYDDRLLVGIITLILFLSVALPISNSVLEKRNPALLKQIKDYISGIFFLGLVGVMIVTLCYIIIGGAGYALSLFTLPGF